MQRLPNLNSPFVRLPSGLLIAPWNSYLQQFTQTPPPIIGIVAGPSPFDYTAVEPGHVSVNGGSVSLIQLIRGNVIIAIVGSNLVPVGIADVVRITYSVLPTIKFIPMYGNAPA